MKAVLTEEKALLGLNEVNLVSVPLYDELAVSSIWPMVKEDEQISRYFPDKFPKGRVPDRCYFWNILNTKQPEYVSLLVKHANAQRNSAANEMKAADTVQVTDEWWDKLTCHPFISRK